MGVSQAEIGDEDEDGGEGASNRAWMRTAWLVVALLWPVAFLNYLDRQMLAAMKYSVMADITDIGNDQNWGYMLGQFKWMYAFLSPIGGYIADRFSRRVTICGSLFVWSMVTWWTGQVHTYQELLWTRTLMGISEAFYIPAALALISDYHSPRTRSRAVGWHQMAIYCGIITGGFSGYIADAPQWGWRSVFDLTGVMGMLYALPLIVFLRNAPRRHDQTPQSRHTAPTAKPAPWAALRELVGNRSFLFLVICFTLPALSGWVVKDWMPAILKDKFAIGQGLAGVSATLYVNVASIVGVILGGWWADQRMRSSSRGRIQISALGLILLAPALVGVGQAGTLTAAILFLVLFGIGWGFFDCNNMPILTQIVRPELRATGYGLMNFVSISCGGFADWGFGTLRDQKVPLVLIFTTFASLAVISALLMIAIRPQTFPSDTQK